MGSIEPGPVTGLCATCEFGESCPIRLARGDIPCPCEDYLPAPNGSRPADNPGDSTDTERGHRTRLGLCATCVNAAHCRLPRPKGGVWHCKEFVSE